MKKNLSREHGFLNLRCIGWFNNNSHALSWEGLEFQKGFVGLCIGSSRGKRSVEPLSTKLGERTSEGFERLSESWEVLRGS